MFVDDRGAHVGDLGALGQAVDHERVQPVGVGTATWSRKSSPPDTNTPTISGSRAAQSRDARTPTAALEYIGVAVHGPRRAVGRLTGRLALLR